MWLNDEMLPAWKAFVAADAWGAWNDYARVLREAGWPANTRPYNAKHSFGKDLGERGVDFQTIADWYGHTNPKTARIYVPVLNSQLRRASELLNGHLGWAAADCQDTAVNEHSGSSEKILAVNVGSMSPEDRNTRIPKLLEELTQLTRLGS